MRWITFFSALLISIFLFIAAYGKFFYPAEKLKHLDILTSVFEIGLIIFLFVFRMRAWGWLIAAVIFASWGGYAIYWCCLKLPCSCLGSMVALPSGYAVALDFLFLIVSCAMSFLLGARRSMIYCIVLCALLCGLVGYAFAEWVFYEKIVGVTWRLY